MPLQDKDKIIEEIVKYIFTQILAISDFMPIFAPALGLLDSGS